MSEVLITLVIIGIIAAITVPAIITHSQKQETISRLKKAYSTLSQGLRKSQSENGAYSEWEKGAEITDINEYFNKYWKPYFNHTQIFGHATDIGYKTNKPWKNLSGNTLSFGLVTENPTRILFTLNDGTVVFFPRKIGSAYLNRIYLDVNGSKNPNVLGKDIFEFQIKDNDNIVPYCSNSDYNYINSRCARTSTADDNCCTAKLLADGWEFKSDYPW